MCCITTYSQVITGQNQGFRIGSPLVTNIHALPQFSSFSTLHPLFHSRALPGLPLPIWLSSLIEALSSVAVDWNWLVWGNPDTSGSTCGILKNLSLGVCLMLVRIMPEFKDFERKAAEMSHHVVWIM